MNIGGARATTFRSAGTVVLLLVTLAAGFAVLRLLALDADPAGYILDEFVTDEGWYAHGARNHALFGRWVMDEHNTALVLCPLHTLALRSSYEAFGPSIWSTRLAGAIASLLTVGLVGWRLRRSPLVAAIAAALVATQPILFALSRVGYCESLQLLFVTAVWYFSSDPERRPRSWFLAGASAGVAFLVKASAIYAPVLALAAPFVRAGEGSRSRRPREVWLAAAGLAVVALVILPFELHFWDILWIEQAREGSTLWTGSGLPAGLFFPLVLGLHWRLGVLPGFWVGLLPFLFIVGIAAARLVVAPPSSPHWRVPLRLAVVWIVLSLGLLCLRAAPAQQERYWINLLVPAACIVALAGAADLETSNKLARHRAWLAAALLAIGPTFLLRHVVLAGLAAALSEPLHVLVRVRYMTPTMLVIGAILTILLYKSRLAQLASWGRTLVALTITVIALNSTVVVASMWSPTYTLRDTSRLLRTTLGSAVLAGDLANTLALETPFRTFLCLDMGTMHLRGGWVNGDWRALGATHWVGDVPPGGEGWRPSPPAEAVAHSSYPAWPDAMGQPRITIYVSSLPRAETERGAADSP